MKEKKKKRAMKEIITTQKLKIKEIEKAGRGTTFEKRV